MVVLIDAIQTLLSFTTTVIKQYMWFIDQYNHIINLKVLPMAVPGILFRGSLRNLN